MYYGDISSGNNTEIVNLFAKFLSTIYYNVNVNQIPEYNYSHVNISSYYIHIKDVIDEVMKTPWKLSYGPDGIPIYFLKQCIFTLAKPLHSIFNLSLNTGTFPSFWKQSYLQPIFKSGTKENVENYRAVCLQSEIPKLFECLVTKYISWDCKNVIVNQQHGFSQNKSVCTNLAIYSKFIINSFESQVQVDSIYTDFSKAFDRVNHDLLLAKLNRLGFSGNILNWIDNYLRGRVQYVKYGNAISSSISVT